MLREQAVLIDRDVADLCGVTTKEVNQAVKNNPAKFPAGYVIALDREEHKQLVKNFDRFVSSKYSSIAPKAFTEKGLYMLATILKSKQATEATLEIIETFAAVKDLQRNLINLHNERNPEKQKGVMSRFSEVLSDIVLPELRTDETETSIELNFFIGKLKHTVKRKRREDGPDIVEEPETSYGNED